jgi:hypothetical protein
MHIRLVNKGAKQWAALSYWALFKLPTDCSYSTDSNHRGTGLACRSKQTIAEASKLLTAPHFAQHSQDYCSFARLTDCQLM